MWLNSLDQTRIGNIGFEPRIDYVLYQCAADQQICSDSSTAPLHTVSSFVAFQPDLGDDGIVVAVTNTPHSSAVGTVRYYADVVFSPKLLLDLMIGMPPLWFCCLDYLDLNSVMFGLIPALHSLDDTAFASPTSTKYWKSRLLREFGAFSDINENEDVEQNGPSSESG